MGTTFRVGARVVLRQEADFSGYALEAAYRALRERRAVGVLKHNMNGVHFTVQFDTGWYLFRGDELELALAAQETWMNEQPTAAAARKRFNVAYNLAAWDGDWETAAHEGNACITALEAELAARTAALKPFALRWTDWREQAVAGDTDLSFVRWLTRLFPDLVVSSHRAAAEAFAAAQVHAETRASGDE